ncbi:MAG: sodium:alanine symporter family protein [Desulfovibrio sp.]|nr:sodium:alanine symporter family protein [Desulfovibrio sp.]
MADLNALIADINSFLWGTLFLIPLLCGTGIFYTVRLRFVQVRKFFLAVRYIKGDASLFGAPANSRGMSSFQALATAIAAQVGTGNVAGTATAMVLGGPGALLWLWVAAFFGMATIFAEAVLAQVYKTTDSEGHAVGGPSWYITRGMGQWARPLAVFFSIAIIAALGFIGNMVQSNTIAEAFDAAFGLPPLATGLAVGFLAALVFIGGISRVASVTEKLVPAMAAMYIAGGSYVLASHAGAVGSAFAMIFQGAFDPQAVFGASIGVTMREAMRYGVARGLFANEAGMGSTPHAHAVARVEHPCQQGLIAIFGVFVTFVIITFTGLVILASGVLSFAPDAPAGIRLTQAAYNVDMGSFGSVFVAVCLFFFAFSTIVGWYFFGAQNVRFLFYGRGVPVYRVMVVIFIVAGSLLRVDLVWQLADMFNAMMVLPNLVALWALRDAVTSRLADFENLLNKSSPSSSLRA